MWTLSNVSQTDCEYHLLVGQEYQVGRKDCPILITGYSSISRKHAVFTVSHTEANLGDHRKLPVLTVQDFSKFGTSVGDQKVKGKTILKSGDVLTFGAMGSQWKVLYQPLVVTSSMLEASLKKKLKQVLLKLGGHLVTEWHKECSHLVMSNVKVTVKTISAMVCCKPIVLPNFFEKMLGAASSRKHMPDPENFEPPVAETTINQNEVSFKSNRERRTLFKKSKFIFFTQKQLKHLGQVISLGGGETVLMEAPPPDWKSTLLGEGVVVMSCDAGTVTDPQQQKWIRESISFLTKNARRAVQESEVGLAVLHSSVDAYCNPEIDPGCLLFQSQAIPSQTLSQGAEVYVSNTESSLSQGPVPSGRSVVSDSNVSGQSQLQTGKKPTKGEQKNTLMSYFGPASKKRAREDTEATENSEAKLRRMEESTDITETPHTSVSMSEKRIKIKQERSPVASTSAKTVANSEVDTNTEAKNPAKVKVEASPLRKPVVGQMEKGRSSDEQEEDDLFEWKPKKKRRQQEPASQDPFEMRPSKKETKEPQVEEIGQGEGVVSCHGDRKRPRQKEEGREELRRKSPEEQKQVLGDQQDGQTTTARNGTGAVHESLDNKTALPKIELDMKLPVCGEREENQPSNLTTVDVVSLVVRKARPVQHRHTETDTANKTPGKNFKKFRKVPYVGMERGLPRIIGGNDLVVATSRVSKEMHDFWEEEMEAESQREREEAMEDDLFRFDVKKSRRR